MSRKASHAQALWQRPPPLAEATRERIRMSFSVVSDGLKRPADEGEAPAPRQVPRLQGPVVELHAPGGAGAVCLHQQEAGRQLLARRVAFCSALFPATPHGALAEA